MNYRLGIDLGGTNIACGVVTEEARLVAKASLPTGSGSPAELMAHMAQCSRMAADSAHVPFSAISHIGIGIPGVCDRAQGLVLLAPNIGLHDFPAADELERLLGQRPVLGNDADCAALGEYHGGAGDKYESMIFVTLGTGVGGGIVIGGKLFTGDGFGGEIGHMTIVSGGEPCPCGRRGCFERYASATALISQTRKAAESRPDSKIWKLCGGDLAKVNGKTPFDAAALGDETAAGVVDGYIGYLAEGLCNLINVLRPEAVIIGGGVSRQGDTLLSPLRGKLRAMVYAAELIGLPDIAAASLGNDAGIIGAAML